MAKRKTPARKIVAAIDPLDDYLLEYAASTPPYVLSSMILFDIDNNPHLDRWIAAIYAVDASNGADKSPLVRMLKSTRDQRDMLLADLIERWVFVKPKSRPRRPAYMMSEDDIILAEANGAVMDMVENGMKVADAKTLVCKERDISRRKLEDFRAGRRRSMRKKK
jgi:hypothetical protein